jgi:NAD(P)H-dependent FMN reductase
MATILGISGSLRKSSFNTMLLHAAIRAVPDGTTIEEASIRDIPLYDGDLEAREFPASVKVLKERVIAADGVLLVTPEYNNSIPGVFKNVIDWLSRPPADIGKVFGAKPFGLIGATPGPGGTNLSQAAWLPVLRTLGTLPYFGGRLGVKEAGRVFDASGSIVDAKVQELLDKYITGFAAFVAKNPARRS